jgi:predicted dehydrogenase
MKDIGLGIAGTGLGAALLEINRCSDSRLEVRALYEPDAGRRHQRYQVGKTLQELAQEFGVQRLVRTYDELVQAPDVDVIAVFSPCPLHAEQVSTALRAGKHVIVTKPMAVSLEEARRLVELVDRTGLKLLVAQSMRWNSMFMTIHSLFANGKLGDIRLAEAYYVHDLRPVYDRSPWRYQMTQDLMYGGVCHPVDLLRWILGEVDEVFAYGSHGGLDPRYPADKADNFLILLKYRNGVTARVMGAFDLIHPPALWRRTFHGVGIGLYGTKASLFNDRIVYEYRGRGQPREECLEPSGKDVDHAGEVIGFLRHFEHCLVSGEKPLVDVRDGAQVVAVCAACWESIRTGQPVKVTREFDTAG